MANQFPVIFVHGLLGFGPKELGPFAYWGSAFKVPSPLKRYEASVGPISSAHDRACELAAQIKGTAVDYGEAHAAEEGHNQFGDDFSGKGFVPDWSEQNPVHLVGHSFGSPTIRCLQHLLATDFWGWGSNERWVHSITTISGVSNGSTLTYSFGIDEETGLVPDDCGLTAWLRILELYTAVSGGILDAIYDFDLDHWGFERQPDETLIAYLERIGQTNFFWGEDNAAYPLTLQGAYAHNGLWQTYPDTYYLSFITEQTFAGWFSRRHYPSPLMNPTLIGSAYYIGQREFATPPILGADFNSADWWENDGLVPSYSQMYPHTNGCHPVGGEFTDETPTAQFERGKWYYQWERGIDHGDICLSPQLNQLGWQRRFYQRLFARLAALDAGNDRLQQNSKLVQSMTHAGV